MISFLAEHAGLIGMFFFMFFFAGMLLWIFRPGTSKIYENCADIPLKEGYDD